jgi:hypothetical protein
MDDHGFDAELAAGALDAQSDLASIGDQDLVEQLAGYFAGHPSLTSPKISRQPWNTRPRFAGSCVSR